MAGSALEPYAKIRPAMKWVLLFVGWVSLVLGLIGVVLPLLPTTPFVLLAALCFSKGSPKIHNWLLKQPHLGPQIEDWERHGVIRPKAKILATLMILALFGCTLVFVKVPIWIKTIVTAIGVGVLAFINTRPSHPRIEEETDQQRLC